MIYRAYFGSPGCEMPGPLDKATWPCRAFSDIEEAVQWARSVAARGTSVIAIEGDDGTRLSRSDLAACLGVRL